MFRIDETNATYCSDSVVCLEVQDLRDLPWALKRLAELGYDMTKPLEVLQEAVEKQRKQNVLKAAINALAEKKS